MIYILNGPNLNRLGEREVNLYGHATLATIEANCSRMAADLGLKVDCRQTNCEGQLIDWVHEASLAAQGLIINAGGLAHTSIALHDALKIVPVPIMEVHLTNVYRREAFRHHSYVAAAATATIAGMGPAGYTLALTAIKYLIERQEPDVY
jgi:3-dehydroquinate dehydratase-2